MGSSSIVGFSNLANFGYPILCKNKGVIPGRILVSGNGAGGDPEYLGLVAVVLEKIGVLRAIRGQYNQEC